MRRAADEDQLIGLTSLFGEVIQKSWEIAAIHENEREFFTHFSWGGCGNQFRILRELIDVPKVAIGFEQAAHGIHG